jgi:hypothetical protein
MDKGFTGLLHQARPVLLPYDELVHIPDGVQHAVEVFDALFRLFYFRNSTFKPLVFRLQLGHLLLQFVEDNLAVFLLQHGLLLRDLA